MPSNPKSLQLKCPYKQILPEGFYLFIYLIYISAWGQASYNDLNLVKISFWIAVPMFNLKEFFFPLLRWQATEEISVALAIFSEPEVCGIIWVYLTQIALKVRVDEGSM